jgi:coenzyme F420-reducing hydrogenase gamma subunit
MAKKPTLAVFKFASCDGCQLSLLSAEDELLAVADAVEIAYFLEARTQQIGGPYDLGLVEGSITTEHDAKRIHEIRKQCRYLVAIGACATAGGIQALRNWGHVDEFITQVYAHPDYIRTLQTSTPVAEHVVVDFELRGCPISTRQLVELIAALVHGRTPRVPSYSVCVECKRRETVCVAVARGVPCLGPVTQAGCGAICPAYCRECFGCYGPKEQANLVSLTNHYLQTDHDRGRLVRLSRNFNGYAPDFRAASEALEASSSSLNKDTPHAG